MIKGKDAEFDDGSGGIACRGDKGVEKAIVRFDAADDRQTLEACRVATAYAEINRVHRERRPVGCACDDDFIYLPNGADFCNAAVTVEELLNAHRNKCRYGRIRPIANKFGVANAKEGAGLAREVDNVVHVHADGGLGVTSRLNT